jgi:hypothetical protein
MDKELAKLLVNAAYRSQRELADIAPLIKEHCSTEEHGVLSLAIGSAIYEANLITERIFELLPELRDEFEARLNKFGRFC